MKLLKVFGVIALAHLIGFVVLTLSPGCRSTSKQAPTPAATEPAPADPSASGTAAPVPVADTPEAEPLAPTDLNPATASGAPVDFYTRPTPIGPRFTPTRPNEAAVESVTTYEVKSGDNLWTIARKHGVTVADITKANKLGSAAAVRPGQKLVLPAAKPAASPAGATGDLSAGNSYKVKAGDSLATIAKRHGTTAAAIRTLNGLTSDLVRVDQLLLLPPSTKTSEGAASSAASAAPLAERPAGAAASGPKHVVKPGESVGTIARHYRVKVADLVTANNIADPKKLRAGQELVIPNGARPPAARPAAERDPAPTPAEPMQPVAPQPLSPAPAAPASGATPAPVDAATPVVPVVPIEETRS